MKVTFLPAADVELLGAAQSYEDRQAGLGDRFIGAAVDASLAIAKHPLRYPPPPAFRGSRNIRRRLLDGFPYAMIYEVRESELVVLAGGTFESAAQLLEGTRRLTRKLNDGDVQPRPKSHEHVMGCRRCRDENR